MLLIDKIDSFVVLGDFLRQFNNNQMVKNDFIPQNETFFNDFLDLIQLSQSHNGWFTPENVTYSVGNWAEILTKQNLIQWTSQYKQAEIPKNIAIILAGNIPLVGFHDFLSVILSGHNVIVKQSSNDQHLLTFIIKFLYHLNPDFKSIINFAEDKLTNFDAVIATGSNNTSRYFEYYFRDKPSIIRKSRNSVAVLDGNETKQQLVDLGEDIFRYFGLGCRNVSKIFVPRNYDFKLFFEAMYEHRSVIEYQKYANNYDYNKAVFLMSNYKLLDNEFLILKEDTSFSSPIAALFYEYYDDLETLNAYLIEHKDILQCIVSNNLVNNSLTFGETQKPSLTDYADGIDTMAFLTNI